MGADDEANPFESFDRRCNRGALVQAVADCEERERCPVRVVRELLVLAPTVRVLNNRVDRRGEVGDGTEALDALCLPARTSAVSTGSCPRPSR